MKEQENNDQQPRNMFEVWSQNKPQSRKFDEVEYQTRDKELEQSVKEMSPEAQIWREVQTLNGYIRELDQNSMDFLYNPVLVNQGEMQIYSDGLQNDRTFYIYDGQPGIKSTYSQAIYYNSTEPLGDQETEVDYRVMSRKDKEKVDIDGLKTPEFNEALKNEMVQVAITNYTAEANIRKFIEENFHKIDTDDYSGYSYFTSYYLTPRAVYKIVMGPNLAHSFYKDYNPHHEYYSLKEIVCEVTEEDFETLLGIVKKIGKGVEEFLANKPEKEIVPDPVSNDDPEPLLNLLRRLLTEEDS